jgi:hypothetical protein
VIPTSHHSTPSPQHLPDRDGNFRQKNRSAEGGIDGTIGLFRGNSGYSAEQETLEIPFRTTPQRRKMFGILYRGTKIKANTWNSVPNHSAEEKPTRNSVPWNKISSHLRLLLIANLLEFRSEACLGRKHAVNTVCKIYKTCNSSIIIIHLRIIHKILFWYLAMNEF